MPGRAEYGLLAGLGQGIAQAGQMALADHFQQMRDERLAKISAEAADGKFARDKELMGMQNEYASGEADKRVAAEREMAKFRVDEEVRGKKELTDYYLDKGLKGDGRADKENKWKPVESSDEYGTKSVSGVSDGNQFIDFSTPVGQRAKTLIDMGKPVGAAVSEAIRLSAAPPPPSSTGGDAVPSSGALPPARGTQPGSQQVAEKQGLFSMVGDTLGGWNESLRTKVQQKRADYEQLQAKNGSLMQR